MKVYFLSILFFFTCSSSFRKVVVPEESLYPILWVCRFLAKGEKIAIIGSESKNVFVAFKNKLPNGQPAQFRLLENNGTNLFDDQLGNLYNAFGIVTEGVDKGKQLEAPNFLVGFWMAFGSFYPNVELFVE